LVPQLVPGALAWPSIHVCVPVAQEVMPAKHAPGLPVQACPAVQAEHTPLPSQTMPVPHAVPADRLPKSRHTAAPVTQLMMPVLHGVGFVVQFVLAVHATQAPSASQTMFVPQLVPAGLLAPSAQVCAPVAHDVVPSLHAPGLPVQGWPDAHSTHMPVGLQTWPTPQLEPAALFAPSLQVVAVPVHDVMPCLHAPGLLVHV
jgi:hypothetical protein